MTKAQKETLSTDDFDRRFDDGEDMADHIDWAQAEVSHLPTSDFALNLPGWMYQGLSRKAARLGVPMDALVRIWIADQLERREQE